MSSEDPQCISPSFSQSLVFAIRKIKNQKKWTKEEDELLIQLAEKYSEKNWKEISKRFIKKNSLQCFSRYKRIRPGIIKGSWKKEEDLQIIDLVFQFGKAWSKISKTLGTRNGKQIRDRYINVLDPEIKKGKFTEEEDNILVQLYYQHGPKWATIAKYYPNRTADMVKNRFHSSIKKRLGLNQLEQVKVYDHEHIQIQPVDKCMLKPSINPIEITEFNLKAKTSFSSKPRIKSVNIAEFHPDKNDYLNQSYLPEEIKEDQSPGMNEHDLNESDEQNLLNYYGNSAFDFLKAEESNSEQDELNWEFGEHFIA